MRFPYHAISALIIGCIMLTVPASFVCASSSTDAPTSKKSKKEKTKKNKGDNNPAPAKAPANKKGKKKDDKTVNKVPDTAADATKAVDSAAASEDNSKKGAADNLKDDKKAKRKEAKKTKKTEAIKPTTPIVLPTKMPHPAKATVSMKCTKKQQTGIAKYEVAHAKTGDLDVFPLLYNQAIALIKVKDLTPHKDYVEALIASVKSYWIKTALGQVNKEGQGHVMTLIKNVKKLQDTLNAHAGSPTSTNPEGEENKNDTKPAEPSTTPADPSVKPEESHPTNQPEFPGGVASSVASDVLLIPVVGADGKVKDRIPDPAQHVVDDKGNILTRRKDGTASLPTIVKDAKTHQTTADKEAEATPPATDTAVPDGTAKTVEAADAAVPDDANKDAAVTPPATGKKDKKSKKKDPKATPPAANAVTSGDANKDAAVTPPATGKKDKKSKKKGPKATPPAADAVTSGDTNKDAAITKADTPAANAEEPGDANKDATTATPPAKDKKPKKNKKKKEGSVTTKTEPPVANAETPDPNQPKANKSSKKSKKPKK